MSDIALSTHATATDGTAHTRDRAISPFEFLPPWIIYGPVLAYWIALGLRYGDMALATLANPNITTGGLCGESKTGILDQAEGEARDWIAPYANFVTGRDDSGHARRIMAELGLTFPVVIKPDIGCKGAGVKLARTSGQLDHVLQSFPRATTVILQKFVPFEGEAGLYYSRQPGEATGQLLSLTLKTPPHITGDGIATIRELIMRHKRAGRAPQVYLPRLGARVEEVLPAGETLTLVFTGNHSKGSAFRDATHLITPALSDRIDRILRSLPDFHHGRIDIRFDTVSALMKGEDFEIIEINGVGSEPIHMWDPKNTLLDIYAAQFRYYGRAFRIGQAMRRRGHRSRGARDMLWHWLAQSRLIATYPPSD
ncbi:ATP-grasp domain-containing protein [Acidisoma silvae]|uniref:ATP-grasp domain-containing protein n=1 Tax=Acidisoma silvae TaxID=2802396 RepID=A0A964E0N7_9PROT|nr:ATP-grasp domain-containing protein [Acidisoma silvae]MCB8876918.1 ATP-grasp domain-containing protein [Acidisoma silvae]